MNTLTMQSTIERACESARIAENILRDETLTDEQQRELIDVLVLGGEDQFHLVTSLSIDL